MASDKAIEIKDLAIRYGERAVLEGFSLEVGLGEKVTLTGASGSGKTTVLKCVLGLVKPAAGEIYVLGERLDGASVWELRRRLAYVAQDPELGGGTAREAIERPFGYRANAGLRHNLLRLGDLCERFNLPAGLLDEEVSTLSGGEKQRVALVSAILLERPIVLLDEASSALDRANKEAVAGYFREAGELTVLSVSHDAEWSGFSGRIVDMQGPGGREERS